MCALCSRDVEEICHVLRYRIFRLIGEKSLISYNSSRKFRVMNNSEIIVLCLSCHFIISFLKENELM